ncbi:MAG: 2Fe-2S iron-sulfur cluster-binding protein [Hydrogenophilaceae bacterium]
MTTQGLLLLILLIIFVQLVVYAGVAFFRYWLSYQALKAEVGVADTQPEPIPESVSSPLAWEGWREFRVVRREYEDVAGHVCSFYLAPADGKPLPAYLPGQFLTFRLDVADPAGGGSKVIVRCYSLSDRPAADHYRISVKRVPAASPGLPAGLSSNHCHDHVRAGDILAVKAPSGHFHLDVNGDGPVVLVAGGIGITPIYSMLSAALAMRPEREIQLFYGVRDGSEMVMRGQIDELARRHANLRLHVCFSRPGPDDVPGQDYRHEGRVDIGRLRLELGLKPYHFYICGPAPMMETLVPALADWGVPEVRIHYEAFGPATVTRRAQAPEAGPALAVTFKQSGRRLDWQAGSLLELAEAGGVQVESGCRSGCCGACQTTIVSGEVAYGQAPEFDVEPGSCLLCLAKPRTDLVLAA